MDTLEFVEEWSIRDGSNEVLSIKKNAIVTTGLVDGIKDAFQTSYNIGFDAGYEEGYTDGEKEASVA